MSKTTIWRLLEPRIDVFEAHDEQRGLQDWVLICSGWIGRVVNSGGIYRRRVTLPVSGATWIKFSERNPTKKEYPVVYYYRSYSGHVVASLRDALRACWDEGCLAWMHFEPFVQPDPDEDAFEQAYADLLRRNQLAMVHPHTKARGREIWDSALKHARKEQP